MTWAMLNEPPSSSAVATEWGNYRIREQVSCRQNDCPYSSHLRFFDLLHCHFQLFYDLIVATNCVWSHSLFLRFQLHVHVIDDVLDSSVNVFGVLSSLHQLLIQIRFQQRTLLGRCVLYYAPPTHLSSTYFCRQSNQSCCVDRKQFSQAGTVSLLAYWVSAPCRSTSTSRPSSATPLEQYLDAASE